MRKIAVDKLFWIRSLIVLVCVLGGVIPAWAGHGGPHYARVTVTASGNGKVYMTTNKDYAPGSEDWKSSMSEDWNCGDGLGPNENDNRTYYVHALANSGYHFAKWSSKSDGSDSKSTANPYGYSTSASSTSSGSPTAINIYAIFEANPQYTCTFLTSTNGTYKYQYGDHAEVTVTSEHSVTTDQNFTFTALPAAGYQVYGWYTESGGVKTYFDYSSYVLSSYALPGNIHIGVDFMPVGTPIFQIKGTTQMFTDLNAAVTACGAATKTIVLVNNGTLPAGDYTIPSNVTLLIPFDANYTCYTETPGTIDSYTSPVAYRTLTMSPGARLIVNGKISLSAKVSGLDVQGPNGVASGPYGAIKMLSEGDTKSTITLNNGGKLYCWGYIYGEGEVEALSGSTVHEGFNFMDFSGAQNTNDMIGESHKVFPFNQYYIQNIEVPLTIHYGATEKVFSCLYPGGYEVPIPITMVGSSDGLFRLTASGAKLTKWYDPHDDRQHYAFEGNAAIRNIEFDISLMGVSKHVNSANFVLPITNNMDIEVRTGATVDIAEDVCIMPDASITVEEGATLNIASGKSVYVYDKNAYTNAGTYTTNRGGYPDAGPGRYALGKYIRSVNYSPSWAAVPDREIRRLAIMHTARFKINGTLNATGKIYTTEGGADIYSDTDGAVINLSTAAGTATVTYQVDHHGYNAYYYSIPITSAQLHNADQSYASTAGSPAGASWTYKHGHWGWKVVWMLEDGTVLKTAYHYAQPDASWLSSNAPSTSRDPEGTCSYSFNGWNNTVNTDNQEVTVVADYTKTCTEYYTITWKSEDGTGTLETDEQVGQGESTRYNGAAPSKPFDTELSRLYTFDGWATEPDGEKVYDIDGTPAASGDAAYYAHFAVTEVVAIVKADDDTTYCTSIEAAFEVVRNTNFTPTIQVWKDASIPALVYNIENYCTLDLNGHTLTSVTSSVQSPFKINKSNITFTITDSSESQSGKLSMTSTYSSTIYGLFVDNGKLMLNGGTIEVISGTATTFGVTANSNGSFILNGGTIHVVTTNNKEGRGVYSAGTVLINDGTVHVEAAGNAYAIRRDGGTVTVNGGKFNINGSSSYVNYGADADANIAIKGGYYTTNNRLATVVPSPYIVYDWASEDEPYKYTVAAKVGYTVTFQNTDGTPLQTGIWVEGTTPAYAGETPTKPGDTEGAWMLGGWTPDLVPVTEDVTYTAVYVPTPPVASVTISGTTTEYIHFDDAWTAVNSASAASTIKLLDDVALASMLTFTSGRNCTFDLNGYTITNTDLVMFNLNKASSTFTLTDGSEGQTGKVVVRSNGASAAYGVLVSKGTFVLHAGTIEAYLQANTSQGVRVANGASFTMEGGTIDVMTTNAKNGDGVFANTTGSATITGGTIRVRAAATGYAVNSVGTVTVTGGHFDAAGGTSAACVAGSPTLQGGYYNININLSDNTSAPYYVFPNADETYLYKVSAGYTLTWSTDGVLSGEGYTPSGLTEVGTPIVAPTSTKEGYVFAGWTPAVAATMPAANTTYTATWAVASVTINDVTNYYTAFATAWTAVNSAGSASTIQLLQDVTVNAQLTYDNTNTQNCTLDLNGHTLTSTTNSRYPLYINKANVTFAITDSGASGTLLLNTTSTSTIFGVYADKGTIQLNGGTIEVRSGSATTCGVTANSTGTFTMNAGTIHVVTTNSREGRGIYSAGTVTVHNGTILVEAAGNGYGLKRDGGTMTVNGGKFNITGSTANVATNANPVIQGGYYNINSNLETCVTAPYHRFDVTSGAEYDEGYRHKVAEGYTLSWNTDGDPLTGDYTSGLTEVGTPIVAPDTPTKTGYSFAGWSSSIAETMPSANTEYTAQWTAINYTINYELNGGSVASENPTSYTVESGAITLNNPTKANYVFAGWTGTGLASATINVTISAGSTGNRSYTATWTPAVASVTISGTTTYYTTFDAAWDAVNGASAASTIQLLQNVTVTSYKTYSNTNTQNCTFDLNGHTLTGTGQAVLHPNKSGTTFTLTDRSTDHNGKIISQSNANDASYGVFVQKGTFVMEAGTIDGQFSKNTLQGVRVGASGSFRMDGGTIHVKTTNGKEAHGIYANGTTTINGGTVEVEAAGDGYGIYYNDNTTTVNAGYFYLTASGSAYVTNQADDNNNVVIKGGYYNIDAQLGTCVTSPCRVHTLPDWHEAYEAGYRYEVIPGAASVTINGATNYYNTFDLAFTAANASATYEPTITLLQDAVTTTTSMLSYTGAKNCTLDLNGYTLSSTTAQALLYINKEGITFTITDLTETQSGTLHLQSTSTDNRWCVYVAKGNLQMDAGTVFLRSKATTYNEGIRIDPAVSTFTMNGGKVHVVTTDSKPACGIVSRGKAFINGGEIQVEASGTGYGIEARVSGANIGQVTVNGGKFLVTGTTAACAYRSDTKATLKLQGGYYNTNANLATYTSAPYEVQETTEEEKAGIGAEYTHKVVENEETGFSLDIVDWTASNLTINANGWTASGWPYMINDVEYAKEARAADRTLTIPYSGEAGTELRIEVQDKDDNIVSLHRYTIPFIGTTSGTSASSTIYVNSGTLTIDASETPTIAALYIRPEASVNVTNGTLTVGKLVMRTLPWQAAAISGDFEAEEVWYTRIAPNKRTISGPYAPITYESASYYQFALPRNCTVALKDIKVSHGANTPYGTTWLLKRYDESIRAEYGAGADNWVALTENETIQGGVGYELFSNSNYYREFYFPIGEVSSEDIGTTTAVTYHSGAAGVDHAGWNIVASPLMSVYDNRGADPETGLKVSWLLTDGSYDQGVPEYIYPAIPFSYQASEGQTVISFEGSSIVAAAPRRSMEEESVRKQWLHLDIKNANGVGDQTSILTHPTRYEETYKTGIDVAKQSFTASRPLLYSSHTYGEMAFAGVADSLLEQGVALTIYSPKPQELTISLRENNWLERLEEVWLIDMENGAQINLLDSDYNFETNEGTTRGRLFLQGRFKALNIATDIENTEATEGNSVKAQKLIIRDKLYIRINGQLYDATGKMVNDK